MYTPKPFRITEIEEIKRVVSEYSFASLISTEPELQISHLPLDYLEENVLFGHLATSNPQSNIQEGTSVTAIFNGPHEYISPTYYVGDFNVPTWNYLAVHAKGTINFISSENEIKALFNAMVKKYESDTGWSLPDEPKYNNLFKAIKFFKLTNITYTAKAKFNQNKSSEDVASVIEALEKVNKSAANAMSRYSKT